MRWCVALASVARVTDRARHTATREEQRKQPMALIALFATAAHERHERRALCVGAREIDGAGTDANPNAASNSPADSKM